MKNLIALFVLASFAFTAPESGELKVNAKAEDGFLSVNVDNQEGVDLKLKVTVYDASGKKIAKKKTILGVNTSDDIIFIADGEDFKNYPLKVEVKGKGREKALFIKVMKRITVDK